MNFKSLVPLVCLVILAASCTKDDPVYHGQIRNGLAQEIHVDLYATSSDYYTNSNPVWSSDIAAAQSATIPASLETGKAYWLDWYSADYTSGNWPTTIQLNMASITPEQDPLLTVFDNPSYARIVCLNSNQTESHWKAVYASNFGTPIWQTLSENDKYRQFTLRKDLTGTYSYKDNQGVVHTTAFNYSPSFGSGLFSFSLYTTFQSLNSYFLSSPSNEVGMPKLDSLEAPNGFPFTTNQYQYTFSKD